MRPHLHDEAAAGAPTAVPLSEGQRTKPSKRNPKGLELFGVALGPWAKMKNSVSSSTQLRAPLGVGSAVGRVDIATGSNVLNALGKRARDDSQVVKLQHRNRVCRGTRDGPYW